MDRLEKQLDDHEARIRNLERSLDLARRVKDLEEREEKRDERMRRLELTQARLVVIVGVSSFGASSLAHWVYGGLA